MIRTVRNLFEFAKKNNAEDLPLVIECDDYYYTRMDFAESIEEMRTIREKSGYTPALVLIETDDKKSYPYCGVDVPFLKIEL